MIKTVHCVILIIFSVVFFLSDDVYSQTENYELELIGRVWFPGDYHTSGDTTGASDCWGYTAPDGTEYAIIGVYEGIAFVRIPDLKVIDVIPGPKNNDYYYHRDIKTYKHYAYAVAEMRGTNEGLMIMDLQYLPDSVRFVKSYIHSNQIRSHNLTIDTANGFAYICAQNYSGFRVVDLSDPENPVDVNLVNTIEIHDVYARNDTVYVAEGTRRTFSIYDMADKNNPILLKRWPVPAGGYCHNIWASEDGKFAMTTEETRFKTVKLWDISDLDNVHIRGEYLAENNIAHNTHIMSNLAYISHYRAGVRIVDISNPDSLIEAAYFPTYGGTATGDFYGNWGAYPFTKEGYVYGSDFEGWLTVLKLNKIPTSVEDVYNPSEFLLKQNYPNPFNPYTTIEYELSGDGYIKLSLFNILGEQVKILYEGFQKGGLQKYFLNASEFVSGVYFYKLETGKGVSIKKMLLQK